MRRVFPALFRLGLAQMVAYRAEIVVWILTATLPILSLLVWDRVVDGGPVGRFDRGAFARYFAVGLVVRQLTGAWVVWDLNEKIRTGALTQELLRPIHPLLLPMAENLAALPTRVVVLTPLILGIVLARPELLQWPDAAAGLLTIPAAILSLCLAWAVTFTIQAAFGCLAFFTGQSLGIWQLWFGLWMLLSGYMIPAELIPGPLGASAAWLPFRAAFGVPVEIAAGLHGTADLLPLLALQLLWLTVALVVFRRVWRAGVRRWESTGG
jgi:ABC-2 type transport system permease protein